MGRTLDEAPSARYNNIISKNNLQHLFEGGEEKGEAYVGVIVARVLCVP